MKFVLPFYFFVFFLPYNSLFAQDSTQNFIKQKATISVTGTAQIFSSDQSFNKQIQTHSVVIQNAKVSFSEKQISDKNILIVKATKRKLISVEKEKEIKQKKTISTKKSIEIKNPNPTHIFFKGLSSDSFSPKSNAFTQGLVLPETQKSQSKQAALQAINSYSRILNHDVATKILGYHTKPKTVYFIHINFVRPPPTLVY